MPPEDFVLGSVGDPDLRRQEKRVAIERSLSRALRAHAGLSNYTAVETASSLVHHYLTHAAPRTLVILTALDPVAAIDLVEFRLRNREL